MATSRRRTRSHAPPMRARPSDRLILEVANRGLMSAARWPASPPRPSAIRCSTSPPSMRRCSQSRGGRPQAARQASGRASPSARTASRSPPPTPRTCARSTRSASRPACSSSSVIVEADKLKRVVEALSESAADTLKGAHRRSLRHGPAAAGQPAHRATRRKPTRSMTPRSSSSSRRC